MYNTFALAVGWWLCLGTQELLYYSCQDLRFAAFCSAGLVSRSDGFGAQQRVGLSPLRGDPQPCCALQTGAASKPWGSSGISSDVIESAFLLRRDPACSHVNRASALRSARGHDHAPEAVPVPGSHGWPCSCLLYKCHCLCQGASEF